MKYRFCTEYECDDHGLDDANGGSTNARSPQQAVLDAIAADVLAIPADAKKITITVEKMD